MKISKIVMPFGIFVAGFLTGSAVTRTVVKNAYRDEANKKAQIEIDHAFERIEQMENKWEKETDAIDDSNAHAENSAENTENVVKDEASILKCTEVIDKCNYSACFSSNKEEKTDKPFDRPYVISPSESDDPDYQTISLNWYKNGVMTDYEDDVVKAWPELIGEESINSFGQYEDDRIFVKNDRLMCIYEVVFVDEDFE